MEKEHPRPLVKQPGGGIRGTNPFVPQKKARRILVSHRAQPEFFRLVQDLGLAYRKTPKLLDFPIGHHPDILWHPLSGGEAVAYGPWPVEVEGVRVLASLWPLEETYPRDVALNVFCLGPYYFGKAGALDPVLQEAYEERGMIFQAIRQGYAKCSVFYLGEEAIVTADRKIHQLVQDLGFRSYLLPPGGIHLAPYNTGFIGGSGGLIGPGKALFYGDPNNYRYGPEFLDILAQEGVEAIYPPGLAFEDLGSILLLE